MKDVNIVVLSGRVASDVSLKTLPSGSKVADFRLAVNERFKDNATHCLCKAFDCKLSDLMAEAGL